jgi:dephospho-CoA kinase
MLSARWIRRTPENRFQQRHYPVIALTGGIASGKSTVAQFLREQNVPVVSADELVKDIYRWPETLNWLAAVRGDVIIEGKIDFVKLRQAVFSDASLKTQIEDFIYARLPQAFSATEKKIPRIQWLVYEIPLLYERGMENLFDAVVVSWVRKDVQRSRLLSRDHTTTPETADAILANQLPLDEKRMKADIVFDNSLTATDKKACEPELQKLWQTLVS